MSTRTAVACPPDDHPDRRAVLARLAAALRRAGSLRSPGEGRAV